MARTNDSHASRDVHEWLDFLDPDDRLDCAVALRNLGFRMGSHIVAILKETATGVTVEIERVA